MSFVSLDVLSLILHQIVINATTLNGAHAMEISDNYGSDIGKKPIYSKKIPSYDYFLLWRKLH